MTDATGSKPPPVSRSICTGEPAIGGPPIDVYPLADLDETGWQVLENQAADVHLTHHPGMEAAVVRVGPGTVEGPLEAVAATDLAGIERLVVGCDRVASLADVGPLDGLARKHVERRR